jgi:KDO2-lipid IV(A) lauroyltransferase
VPAPEFETGGVANFLIDLLIRAFFGLVSLLPYRVALKSAGWVAARVLAPMLGANRRINENLDLVWPEMAPEARRALCAEVAYNSARLMFESFRVSGFLRHARRSAFTGPGRDTLLDAAEAGQPVILVSGHFGNYQAIRVLLRDKGIETAAIYRPLNNAYTNARYIRNMDRIATPNHPRGMVGTKGLLGHLRKGGVIALLNDQGALEGKLLDFMGEPALTMTSAAEFALKYKALLIPYYGIRQENRVDFEVVVEAPIPHSDPETMTQALNDSLAARIRAHPGQWFWVHRRWKRYD